MFDHLAIELLSDARELLQQAQQSARRLTGRMRIGFLADEYATPVGEERLLAAVRGQLGLQVERLMLPPVDADEGNRDPLNGNNFSFCPASN